MVPVSNDELAANYRYLMHFLYLPIIMLLVLKLPLSPLEIIDVTVFSFKE